MISTLLTLFILLCIVGVILWGIGQIPGIPQIVKTVIYVMVAIVLLLYCLHFVGAGGVRFQ